MSELSDRWSDRVESTDTNTAGHEHNDSVRGPESMPSGERRTRAQQAEGVRRVSRAELQRIAVELSDRERAVMESVVAYGFLTTKHIERLHFHDHATAEAGARITRRVLERLRKQRILEPLERRIGGLRAGSASYIWRIGPAGDRLLAAGNRDQPRDRRKQPSVRFLEHRLAVAECAVRLTVAAREGVFDLIKVDPEPVTWRRYNGDYSSREILKPDLFAITADGDYEDHWFIEVDRGTESLPTVIKQCQQYEHYRRTGTEQSLTGLFPRVIWLVPDEHREHQLRAAIERADLDDKLFRVHQYGDLFAAITTNKKGGDDA